MAAFKSFLKESNFFARALTFGMIPLFWRIFLAIGLWYGDQGKLLLFGIAGIWIGVGISHQLYYRWIFPEKNNPKEC